MARIFCCRWRLWPALLLLALAFPAAGSDAGSSPDAAGRGSATVLIYHHFGDGRYPTTNVDMAAFRQQLAHLASERYHVIPLAELVKLLREKRPLPEKTAVITIDDGYRTIYTNAWPLLKQYGFPFTVFLYVEGLERGYGNYLTWAQVREMQGAGVDFQDHSYFHRRLANRPGAVDEAGWRAWIRDDLAKGRQVLTARLGRAPRFFAIPYGQYNTLVIDEAKKLGYEAILTQDGGAVGSATDPLLLPREPILGREWATMPHFKEVLARVDLPLASLEPGIAPLANRTPARIGARLLHPERYDPESFGIYVSERGWAKARLQDGVVAIPNQRPLARPMNRVMVSAREKATGRTAVRFWMLMAP
ncbi:MAG: polysaccharide deacetylase family protein [Thermodesulfobacteriota bacterium]